MSAPIPTPDLTAAATRILAGLIGWRWTWPAQRVVDVYRVPFATRTINLYGQPVSAVHSVTGPSGDVIDPSGYQLNNDCQLWLLQPQDWWWPGGLYDIATPPPWSTMPWTGTRPPPAARDISVDYTYGSAPPIDIQRAINQLAQQFALAEACDAGCKLPERVTSLTREGVSYTLIDPQDFLDQGRTGLYFVDLVVKTYVGTKTRARVSSPELPPPRRISTVQVT
jgi:hypothetical protein